MRDKIIISSVSECNKFILRQLFHSTKMESTISVLRNKTNLCLQFFMTKYEPHSCSKIVMAVKAISLALVVSNSRFSDGL